MSLYIGSIDVLEIVADIQYISIFSFEKLRKSVDWLCVINTRCDVLHSLISFVYVWLWAFRRDGRVYLYLTGIAFFCFGLFVTDMFQVCLPVDCVVPENILIQYLDSKGVVVGGRVLKPKCQNSNFLQNRVGGGSNNKSLLERGMDVF